MIPKVHILVGAIVSIILYFLFSLNEIQAIIIFLSSFLIDVDHYIIYALEKKDLSLKNARNYFHNRRSRWLKLTNQEQEKYKRDILLFHGIEFWIPLMALSFYFPIINFVIQGFAIHIALDYIELIHYNQPLFVKSSQITVHITNKRKINFN